MPVVLMRPRTKIILGYLLWGTIAPVLLLASTGAPRIVIPILGVLLVADGWFLMSVKCSHCKRAVLLRDSSLGLIQIKTVVAWPPSDCVHCKRPL